MDSRRCSDYFAGHLAGLCGRRLLPGVRSISTCFEVKVEDCEGPPWRVVISQGKLVSVSPDGPEPACRFELDSGTMHQIVSGEESPQVAFFENRVDISGDIETGLVLSTALEPFFRLYPYAPAMGGDGTI